jgi:hypothetical protein
MNAILNICMQFHEEGTKGGEISGLTVRIIQKAYRVFV